MEPLPTAPKSRSPEANSNPLPSSTAPHEVVSIVYLTHSRGTRSNRVGSCNRLRARGSAWMCKQGQNENPLVCDSGANQSRPWCANEWNVGMGGRGLLPPSIGLRQGVWSQSDASAHGSFSLWTRLMDDRSGPASPHCALLPLGAIPVLRDLVPEASA
jgi:hypothetical protein